MMRLGYTENGATNAIRGQVSSIWAKECMCHNCECVILLDMTNPDKWRETVVEYYLLLYYSLSALCIPSQQKMV